VLLIGAGDELLAVPALGGDPRAITLIGADGQPHTDVGADGQNNEPPIRANEADGQQDSDQLPDVTHSSCLASNRIGSDRIGSGRISVRPTDDIRQGSTNSLSWSRSSSRNAVAPSRGRRGRVSPAV
jgi:hypothetical protein